MNPKHFFRAWLERHHAERSRVVVRLSHDRDTMVELIDTALAFGWHLQAASQELAVFVPRNPLTPWDPWLRNRMMHLLSARAMEPSGQRLIDEATYYGSLSEDRDPYAHVTPQDLVDALAFEPVALERWRQCWPELRACMIMALRKARTIESRESKVQDIIDFLNSSRTYSLRHPVESRIVERSAAMHFGPLPVRSLSWPCTNLLSS